MCRCWGSRAGGTDHWPIGARRGTQSLSCCCLCRDLRLIEVTETICKRLLDYSLHKERTGSNRFAKVGLGWGWACPYLSVSAGMGATWRWYPGSLPLWPLPIFINSCLLSYPPEGPDFLAATDTFVMACACPSGSCLSLGNAPGWWLPWRPEHLNTGGAQDVQDYGGARGDTKVAGGQGEMVITSPSQLTVPPSQTSTRVPVWHVMHLLCTEMPLSLENELLTSGLVFLCFYIFSVWHVVRDLPPTFLYLIPFWQSWSVRNPWET